MSLRMIMIAALIGGGIWFFDHYGIGKTKTYDVFYFPTPGAKAEYVGRVEGIRDCRQHASMKAQMQKNQRFTNDYTCCLVTEKSKCERNDQ